MDAESRLETPWSPSYDPSEFDWGVILPDKVYWGVILRDKVYGGVILRKKPPGKVRSPQ